MNSFRLKIDTSWTLFLDRDGVINRRIVDGYVRSWDQFEFLPGTLEALKILSGFFGKLIVVSNQQGIGKGLMTEEDLRRIHEKMTKEAGKAGGRIDQIYHCPSLESENSFLRKPNVGMALKARKEFREIKFKRSVMAGDSASDMIFGKRLGMVNVFISGRKEQIAENHHRITFAYPDLLSFAIVLINSKGELRQA